MISPITSILWGVSLSHHISTNVTISGMLLANSLLPRCSLISCSLELLTYSDGGWADNVKDCHSSLTITSFLVRSSYLGRPVSMIPFLIQRLRLNIAPWLTLQLRSYTMVLLPVGHPISSLYSAFSLVRACFACLCNLNLLYLSHLTEFD